MSKTVFPNRGGLLVDDDARIVKTIKHRAKNGTYTIKIVDHVPLPRSRRTAFTPLYTYHFLSPDGAVTDSTAKEFTVKSTLAKALASIREDLRRRRQVIRLSRMSPEQRQEEIRRKKHSEAVKFFRKHGGILSDKYANLLADAEQLANENDWTVDWRDDLDYQVGNDEETPDEVFVAVLKDGNGKILTSVGGIADPDANYQRVVEAELASEVMATI